MLFFGNKKPVEKFLLGYLSQTTAVGLEVGVNVSVQANDFTGPRH